MEEKNKYNQCLLLNGYEFLDFENTKNTTLKEWLKDENFLLFIKSIPKDYIFISKLNNSLRKELEDDLLKLQEYYDGINVLEYKTFALLKCNSYYEKGRINEELIDKIKKYYINLFKKKIAKELEEMQKEKERRNILKTNQELILKKIGE
ncbi:hypothetical protein E0023_06905 [Campylobacter coli]|nr:hypothetical protein [Campylobacter coli]EAH6757810.1 hypothetical protein [Campylobacter coli]EAJ0310862.1 hypothetical protein [Campylobacter coli]EAJ8972295.1 hypothetical protein [Campylobacter coli]EIR1400122.1 hypothetical protein [Campylobacter coli]